MAYRQDLGAGALYRAYLRGCERSSHAHRDHDGLCASCLGRLANRLVALAREDADAQEQSQGESQR